MIFVEPRLVRSGVGRVLWRHAEERARAHGAARLTLDADPNAVPFYERMGLRIVGQSPSGSIPGRMLPRMEKELRDGKPGRAT
jgi:GNAT superfamily N-acetyltransferase